jgi:hypothetical protein
MMAERAGIKVVSGACRVLPTRVLAVRRELPGSAVLALEEPAAVESWTQALLSTRLLLQAKPS